MARSLKVAPNYMKLVKSALSRNGFSSQQALAEKLGLSRPTVNSFLNGRPVDSLNFKEIAWQLGLDWKKIADLEIETHQDWGEAPDIPIFCGRTEQLNALQQWIVTDKCRLVALLGMGGIGKTALSVRIAQQLQGEFEYVIWRSLRNAPPIEEILADMIKFLSNQQETDLPDTLAARIALLIHYLRSSRCLLILDNVESILREGERAGQYREGYEDYSELLRQNELCEYAPPKP